MALQQAQLKKSVYLAALTVLLLSLPCHARDDDYTGYVPDNTAGLQSLSNTPQSKPTQAKRSSTQPKSGQGSAPTQSASNQDNQDTPDDPAVTAYMDQNKDTEFQLFNNPIINSTVKVGSGPDAHLESKTLTVDQLNSGSNQAQKACYLKGQKLIKDVMKRLKAQNQMNSSTIHKIVLVVNDDDGGGPVNKDDLVQVAKPTDGGQGYDFTISTFLAPSTSTMKATGKDPASTCQVAKVDDVLAALKNAPANSDGSGAPSSAQGQDADHQQDAKVTDFLNSASVRAGADPNGNAEQKQYSQQWASLVQQTGCITTNGPFSCIQAAGSNRMIGALVPGPNNTYVSNLNGQKASAGIAGSQSGGDGSGGAGASTGP